MRCHNLNILYFRVFLENAIHLILELGEGELSEVLCESIVEKFHDNLAPLIGRQYKRSAGRKHRIRRCHVIRRWTGCRCDLRPRGHSRARGRRRRYERSGGCFNDGFDGFIILELGVTLFLEEILDLDSESRVWLFVEVSGNLGQEA